MIVFNEYPISLFENVELYVVIGFLVSQFFFFIFLNCFYRLSKVEKHFYHLKALHDDSIIKLGVFMHLQCRGINDGFGFLNLIQ